MSIPGNFSEKVTSRYSKLSSALKKSLFDSVFVDGLNIREVFYDSPNFRLQLDLR